MLEPIGQGHVAMGQGDGGLASDLRRDRVLLREDEAHDVAQLDVLQEELDVKGIMGIVGRLTVLVLAEIILGDHLDVGVVGVDVDGSTQGNGHGPVPGEEGPPDPFPESLIGAAQLRTLDAV